MPGTGTTSPRWLRWRSVALAALLPITGLVGLTVDGWFSEGDPDPGGRTLNAMKSVEVALPPTAVDVTPRYAEAHWDSCDGRAGASGWSDIGVYLTFVTAPDPYVVVSKVTAGLEAIGWAAWPGGSSPLPQLPPGAISMIPFVLMQQFTRTLPNGEEASAGISSGPRDGIQTIVWSLTAVAAPQGQRATC